MSEDKEKKKTFNNQTSTLEYVVSIYLFIHFQSYIILFLDEINFKYN